jgi:hypothetical protein
LVVKKVDVASVSFTEAFPMPRLALQLEVPTAASASIPGQKVGKECCNSARYGRLEAVAASIHLEAAVPAMLEAARLWETLPTTSRVLGPYENRVT